ncbi:MAG TPA: hypothetical protein VLT45_23645, partial [Kofleriaceae bacterium]|nr:hypothetical protein [Kofleriaceae bacterium]
MVDLWRATAPPGEEGGGPPQGPQPAEGDHGQRVDALVLEPERRGEHGEHDERNERDERDDEAKRGEHGEHGEHDERDERDERDDEARRGERGEHDERDERDEHGARGARRVAHAAGECAVCGLVDLWRAAAPPRKGAALHR